MLFRMILHMYFIVICISLPKDEMWWCWLQEFLLGDVWLEIAYTTLNEVLI